MAKKIDYLAEEIIQVLEQNHGKPYAEEKRAELSGKDRFQVLVWMNTLDKKNLETLANRLSISPDALDITRNTVRAL